MPQSRQLAAIMFTDIVGYTALMGKDEVEAINVLERNRLLHKSAIQEFKGKWLKEMGDGVLASFNTVSDAVNCAMKIQEVCRKDEIFSLRIGIHQGEVVFKDADVFGDGVNIASRIESIAPAGCIYVSEAVSRNIENKKGISSKYIGEKELKNLKYPVRIYQIIKEEHSDEDPSNNLVTIPRLDEENSIAILPFVNMSNDPEQEYFCDGLSEELLNVLAQLGRIKVAARTSSFIFKGQKEDIAEIGKKLKVNTILEGSVRKSGNRIRITTQLINVKDGFHLWSEKYDREMTDIFDIQDEIALAILNELKIKLLGDEKESILKRDTDNTDAYQYFLKGRFNFHSFTGEGYLTAIKYYDKALEISPDYAKAHAGRASCYLNLWHFVILPPEQSFQQMHDSTFKALELNDRIAESHYAMARYKLWHDFDLKGAEKEFLNTFKFNPNIPEAIAHYGFVSNFLGHREKAISLVRKSKDLDPFSPMAGLDLIANLWVAGETDLLLEEASEILEIHPQFWGAHFYIAYYHWKIKEYDKAIDKLKKVMELFYGQVTLSLLGCLYGVLGEKEKALEIRSELDKMSKNMHVGSFSYALIYAGMGDMDKTFHYLEKAGQERTGLLIFLDYFARDMIPSLNQDQRFKPYLEKVGIPQCDHQD